MDDLQRSRAAGAEKWREASWSAPAPWRFRVTIRKEADRHIGLKRRQNLARRQRDEGTTFTQETYMLPTFPKAQKILDETRNKRMFAATTKVFPHHIHPPVLPIIEGKNSDFQREDRQVKPLKMRRHRVTAKHKIEDGKGMTLEMFYQKAEELGEGWGKQMWEMLTCAIDEAVAETGNEVKVKKGDLKQDDILRLLAMCEQNFDEHGNPTAQLVFGSEFAEELKTHEAEWSNDKEFQAKVEEIKKRKKAEFNEREASRRLVD